MIKSYLFILKNMMELSIQEYKSMLNDVPDWMEQDVNLLIELSNKTLTELNKENPNSDYINTLAGLIKNAANRINEMNISKN